MKGVTDMAGGGQFSGRMTAPMCVAGGILLQLLAEKAAAEAAATEENAE